jgi:hypothetical protein
LDLADHVTLASRLRTIAASRLGEIVFPGEVIEIEQINDNLVIKIGIELPTADRWISLDGIARETSLRLPSLGFKLEDKGNPLSLLNPATPLMLKLDRSLVSVGDRYSVDVDFSDPNDSLDAANTLYWKRQIP